ncbi:hypothetical protein EV363DRAFT_1167624 [Boletus edulis]|nr:hypothetical protein EV363DRAFT_1167624 [Boletus edulis]
MVPLTIIPLMMPRFIISIRELYDHDLHRHLQGIDSEFGVLSQLVASENAVVSGISFVDINPWEADGQEVQGEPGGAGDSEAIQLEVLGNGV